MSRHLLMPCFCRPRPVEARRGLLTLALMVAQACCWAGDAVLDRRVDATWQNVALKKRLASFEALGWSATFLDRRVDPSTPLNADQSGALGDVLSGALQDHAYGVSQLDGLLYVGPLHACRELRTLAELNRRGAQALPAAQRQALRRVDSLEWPRLTEPRMLIESLVKAHGLKLANPSVIPHDVWDAGHLPAMTLSDRLTLLLIGFDLTFQPTGADEQLQLLQPPRPIRIQKSYRANRPVDLTAFAQQFPDCETAQRGRAYSVAGTVEAHDAFAALVSGERAAFDKSSERPSSAGDAKRLADQRLTLTVKGKPAVAVLEHLARSLELELSLDAGEERLQRQIQTRVELSVREATLQEVLGKIATQSGLEITVEGTTVQVRCVDD